MRINKFLGRWRSLREEAEPAKGIEAGEDGLYRLGKRCPRHAMKAIASRDEIALQFHLLMFVYKLEAWLMRRDIKQLDILDVEQDVSTVVEACCNQVPQDFMLWVQRDGTPI